MLRNRLATGLISYGIALGVRRDERELRNRLDAAFLSEGPNVEALLRSYYVPQLPAVPPQSAHYSPEE